MIALILMLIGIVAVSVFHVNGIAVAALLLVGFWGGAAGYQRSVGK